MDEQPGPSTAGTSKTSQLSCTNEIIKTKDESATFYFESDHLALKGNEDYQLLLKTLVLLESQRIKAIEDLDKLHQLKTKALEDPVGFVQQLQSKEELKLPGPQKIALLPDIPWEKYTSDVDLKKFGFHRHLTRGKNKDTSDLTGNVVAIDKKEVPVINKQLSSAELLVIRGRLKDSSKPSTFNQLWTADEQRRLEELLVEYPPERVEAHRYVKIAKALGNRTTQQVASRIQKYFIRLAKAGLPIPGRMPNLAHYSRRSHSGHARYQKFYYQPSTFMQSYEPPVYMDDDDTKSYGESSMENEYYGISSAPDSVNGDNENSDDEIPTELRNTEEFKEFQTLKKLKKQKLQGVVQHIGYKCDSCNVDPIIGTRWHCTQCPEDQSMDFCDNCAGCHFETNTHAAHHQLEPIAEAENPQLMDSDYMRFMPGGYNYLDTNYMPAS